MKIKRILGVLFIFLVVLVLVACGDKTDDKGNDEEKAVPVYQGMTVSKELTTLNSRTGYSLMNATIEDSEEVNQDDPYDNFDGSNIEDEIKKDLEVITSDDVEYFVEQVTDFFITIKLSNPDNFEILSFTLNGKFYQSYQFEYGSDSENLILKANSGDVSGIKDFTIDTIKYIDRTEIKDVIFAGDRTIKVGVTYDNLPFARTTNLNIETNSVSFNAEIADINNLIELYESSLKVYLYDGEEIIESIDLEVGSNLVSFSKLKQDTLYQYAVVTSYDALDGNGSVMVVLEKYAFYTNKMLTFGNVNASQENLAFELVIDDKEELGKITVIELFKDSELVESLEDLNSREFNNLLSNNLYEIKVTYSYDLNDGVGVQTVVAAHSVTTLTKATPTVAIVDVVEIQEEISFELDVIDIDQVGAVTSIELFKDNELVESLEDLNSREFNNLLSNNLYEIKVTYSYDLNDGVGVQTVVAAHSVTTLTKATPTVEVINISSTKTSISFELDINDSDKVGSVIKVELYKDDELVKELEDLSLRTFDELLSDTEYKIKGLYSYDLNDGKGVRNLVVTKIFTTLSKTIPTVEVINISSTKTSISFELDINDSDKVGSVIKVELYKDDELVKELEDLSLRTFDELLSDTEYKIKGLYSYDLNDGVGLQDLLFETHKYYTFSEYYNNPYNPHFTSGYIYAQIKEMPGSNEWYSGGHVIEPFTDSDDGNVPYMINLILDKPVSFAGLNIYSEYSIITVYCEYDGENYLGKADTFRFRKLDFNPVIKTQPKETPTLDIINIIETQNSVEFDLDITDSDDVGSVSKIALYKGDELVKELEDLSLRTFNDLLSNNEYEIKVIYSYDLNDGKGVRNLVVTKIFTTLSKTIPTVAIVDVVETQEEISFELDVIDIDQVGAVTSIELFKDNELVESLEDLNSREFNNLLSNNLYEIKVTYSYDLNDGVGVQTVVAAHSVTTLTKATPTVVIDNVVPTQTSIGFGITVTDVDQVGAVSAIELYQGEALIEALTDLTIREFSGLLSNNEYKIKVTYTYDLNDGVGSQTLTINQSATTVAKATPTVVIDNVVPTQTSIGFGITVTDVDQVGAVSAIELYQGEALIEALTDLTIREFSGLLSNNEYKIKVTYTYDLNDGVGSQTLTINQSATTVAKATPVVVVDNVAPTQTSIGFGITVTDVDQVGAVSAIELYQGETLVEALTDLSVREFTGLFSNNEYTIKVTYTYDLNDGVGEQTLITTETVTTLAKADPIVSMDNVVPTQTSIGFGITVTDVDQVGAVSAIELYQGETLVEALTDLSVREFTGLFSNNEYTIKVTYTYDLNDGFGSKEINNSYLSYTKAAYIDIISSTVLNSTAISVGEEVSLRINFSNTDIVTINAVYVNGIRFLLSGNVTSSTIINFIPETSGGNYSLFIEAIEYTANGVTTIQENVPIFEKVITIFGNISVTSFNEEGEHIYTVSGQSSTILINLNNPNNYTVNSIVLKINDTDYIYNIADFIDVSMDSLKVNLNNLYYETNRISLVSMTFSLDSSNTKTVDFSDLYLTLFKVNSADIIEVSTIEQLSDVQNGNIYSLINNLDATGFSWIPKDFYGVIYGNGYSINNLSITVNNLSTSQQKIGLFTEFSGAIMDLKLNNTYISVNTKGDVMLGSIAALSKEYAQFSNITVDNITIRVTSDKYSYIGGVVGQSSISFFDKIYVSNIQIYGKSNDLLRVGGMIGYGGGYQIAYIKESFLQNMYAELEFNTNYSAVAGIVGEGTELLILDTYVANMEIHILKNSSVNYTMGASIAVGFSMNIDNVYAYNVKFFGDIPVNFGGIVAGHSWMSYINDSFAYKIFINDVETTNLIGEGGYTASNIYYGNTDFVYSENFYLTTLKWSEQIWEFSSLNPTDNKLAFFK